MRRPLLVVPAVVLALAITGCGAASTGETAAPAGSPTASAPAAGSSASGSPASSPVATEGRYVDLADYESDPAAFEGATVVLFFAAPWCPTCRETDENLLAEGVPAGLTVVKTDYDTETDLRRKYGVTVQHTFVQVDEMGTELTTFTGSTTGEDILANTV